MRLAGTPLAPADLEQQQRARGRAMGEGGGAEALQEALEKLQRENRSLRAKVPRYHALCGLYHEAGQQLKHLQVQVAAKDALVRELRAGLAGEAAAAAPARSLVDSLVEQLSQVKQQLRERDRAAAQEAEARSQVRLGLAAHTCQGVDAPPPRCPSGAPLHFSLVGKGQFPGSIAGRAALATVEPA